MQKTALFFTEAVLDYRYSNKYSGIQYGYLKHFNTAWEIENKNEHHSTQSTLMLHSEWMIQKILRVRTPINCQASLKDFSC